MHKVIEVQPLDGYRLALVFDDGLRGEFDVSHLAGRGVFEIWNDRARFNAVSIGSAGELLWNSEADLCPDSLYRRMTQDMDGVNSKVEPVHAGD